MSSEVSSGPTTWYTLSNVVQIHIRAIQQTESACHSNVKYSNEPKSWIDHHNPLFVRVRVPPAGVGRAAEALALSLLDHGSILPSAACLSRRISCTQSLSFDISKATSCRRCSSAFVSSPRDVRSPERHSNS